MSDLENQLATDLGEGSANTEQQAETLEAQDTQSEVESGSVDETTTNQETDDVDVAREIDARKKAAKEATLQGQIKSYQSNSLVLENSQVKYCGDVGVYISEGNNNYIINSSITDNGFYGINIFHSDWNYIYNSTIANNSYETGF